MAYCPGSGSWPSKGPTMIQAPEIDQELVEDMIVPLCQILSQISRYMYLQGVATDSCFLRFKHH